MFTKWKQSLCEYVLEIARHIFKEKNHCRNRQIVIYVPQARLERNALMKCVEFIYSDLKFGGLEVAILYLSSVNTDCCYYDYI